jgi:hypothetical protein
MIISISIVKYIFMNHVSILYSNLLTQTTGIPQAVINIGILLITVDYGKYFLDSLIFKDFLVYPLLKVANGLNIMSIAYIIYTMGAL